MNCPFCGTWHYGSPYADSVTPSDPYPLPSERVLRPLKERACRRCREILVEEVEA